MKIRNLFAVGVLASGLGCTHLGEKSDGVFKVGLAFAVKGAAPVSSSVPEAVKQEASSPTLNSPSGNSWGGDQIGSYKPNPIVTVFDAGVYAEVSSSSKSEDGIQPYGRINLKYAVGPSKGTEDTKNYLHEQDMRGSTPSEWVIYIYDVERDAFPIAPEVGFRLNISGIRVLLGVEYERATWSFYKGIETYGSPQWTLIDKSHVNVLNTKIGIALLDNDIITIGALAPVMGEIGYGGFFNFQFGF